MWKGECIFSYEKETKVNRSYIDNLKQKPEKDHFILIYYIYFNYSDYRFFN